MMRLDGSPKFACSSVKDASSEFTRSDSSPAIASAIFHAPHTKQVQSNFSPSFDSPSLAEGVRHTFHETLPIHLKQVAPQDSALPRYRPRGIPPRAGVL